MSKIIDKPWGYIFEIVNNEKYCGKKLFIKKGCRISLQSHFQKHETIYLYQGTAKVTVGGNTRLVSNTGTDFDKGIFIIPPTIIHRLEALEDCIFFEFSMPDNGTDIIRIEDDWKRV